MLIDMKTLDAIVEGRVTLVFRKWRRPTVRAGGTLRTARGVLGIDSIKPTAQSAITALDARKAGYCSRTALLNELDRRKMGVVYRIAIRPVGDDPRIALRKRTRLRPEEVATLRATLARLDKVSRTGPWTLGVLAEIRRHPDLPAAQLAKILDCEKDRLKLNVRKLKNLGLTESRSPGYRISPRGRAVLTRILSAIAADPEKPVARRSKKVRRAEPRPPRTG